MLHRRLNSVYLEMGMRIMAWCAVAWQLATGVYITFAPHRLVSDSWRWLDSIPGGSTTVGVGFLLGAALFTGCLLFSWQRLAVLVSLAAGLLLLFMAFALSISGLTGHTGGLGGFAYGLIGVFHLVQSQIIRASSRE